MPVVKVMRAYWAGTTLDGSSSSVCRDRSPMGCLRRMEFRDGMMYCWRQGEGEGKLECEG